MIYFAYGSNMDPAHMARLCPGARALGPARLPGHRLVFTRDSTLWGGGVGHVEPDVGEDVWGVLWEITPAHQEALDDYESVAAGWYYRATVSVETEAGMIEALVYLANPHGSRRPSRRYVATLVRAARAHGLPADYVERLEALRR